MIRSILFILLVALLCSACNRVSSKTMELYDECVEIMNEKGMQAFERKMGVSADSATLKGKNMKDVYQENSEKQCQRVKKVCKKPDSAECQQFLDAMDNL